jgi:hypothetical protein
MLMLARQLERTAAQAIIEEHIGSANRPLIPQQHRTV